MIKLYINTEIESAKEVFRERFNAVVATEDRRDLQQRRFEVNVELYLTELFNRVDLLESRYKGLGVGTRETAVQAPPEEGL